MTGRIKASEKVHYIASTTFTIDRKYSTLKVIGKGSYGVVCSALDMSKNKKVAIKKITPMARDCIDAKHTLREIRLMRYLGKHENIMCLEDIMIRDVADELYLVMELFDSDLHRVIQSQQDLSESHYKHFMHQLLCGVKHMHDNRIIHRDLKPGNLLVSRDCRLKITDFGLARERPTGKGLTLDDDIDEPMTENVVTRWYRPPELMLCPDGLYDYSVDIWSCGCIYAEMLGRRPLFPGKNFIQQLTLIFDVIGCPTSSQVAHIHNGQAKKFLSSQHGKRKVPFEVLFPGCDIQVLRLIDQMLDFEPDRRVSVDEALDINYFSSLSNNKSRVFPEVSPLCEFGFERTKLTKQQLKELIVNEGKTFRGGKQQGVARDSNPSAATKPSTESVPSSNGRSTSTRRNSINTKRDEADDEASAKSEITGKKHNIRDGSNAHRVITEDSSGIITNKTAIDQHLRKVTEQEDVLAAYRRMYKKVDNVISDPSEPSLIPSTEHTNDQKAYLRMNDNRDHGDESSDLLSERNKRKEMESHRGSLQQSPRPHSKDPYSPRDRKLNPPESPSRDHISAMKALSSKESSDRALATMKVQSAQANEKPQFMVSTYKNLSPQRRQPEYGDCGDDDNNEEDDDDEEDIDPLPKRGESILQTNNISDSVRPPSIHSIPVKKNYSATISDGPDEDNEDDKYLDRRYSSSSNGQSAAQRWISSDVSSNNDRPDRSGMNDKNPPYRSAHNYTSNLDSTTHNTSIHHNQQHNQQNKIGNHFMDSVDPVKALKNMYINQDKESDPSYNNVNREDGMISQNIRGYGNDTSNAKQTTTTASSTTLRSTSNVTEMSRKHYEESSKKISQDNVDPEPRHNVPQVNTSAPIPQNNKKSKLTVPKSPQFSKMSWERKMSNGGAAPPVPEKKSVPGMTRKDSEASAKERLVDESTAKQYGASKTNVNNRSSSAPRQRVVAEEEEDRKALNNKYEEEDQKTSYLSNKIPAPARGGYANPTASSARSTSTGRTGSRYYRNI